MQSLINKIIKFLKNRVHQNNFEIQQNQDEIRRILNSYGKKNKENDALQERNYINEELFGQNEDFLHLQIKLQEFCEKYGHLFTGLKEAEAEPEDENALPYFKKTIEGELSFKPGHPQYSNTQFFNQLLKYYEENENYEMCDQLVKMKRTENKF